jgi:hypothetical protein
MMESNYSDLAPMQRCPRHLFHVIREEFYAMSGLQSPFDRFVLTRLVFDELGRLDII